MKYMIYSSKYNAILKMLLLLPGRVAMEECSRLFVLNLGHTICFSGKGGGSFIQQLKLEYDIQEFKN